MFKTLGSWLGYGKSAGTQLPLIVNPKVSNKPIAVPSYVKRTATSTGDQRLLENDRQVASTDLLTLRTSAKTKEVIRNLAATSPDLSASVHAYIRLVVTRNFTAVARNQDGTANPEATAAAQQLLNRFNFLQDYAPGFSGTTSVHAVGEQLTKELRLYGACSMELVLDKARLPSRMQPISVTQVQFHDDGTGYVYPVQVLSGRFINLDQPTFLYETLDQDLLEAYSASPLEAAVQPTLQDAEFTNDLRRVVKRAIHPRMDVKIDFEVFKKNIPMELQGDSDKVRAYQDEYISGIQAGVNGLQPDDALVHFDSVAFDHLNNGNISLDREYQALQSMVDAKVASGSKTPAAVLGHAAGSQNIASTETMLFLKYAAGVQNKVNSIISRGLTLGIRLLGYDVFVEFSFAQIDLRPDAELAAFRSMDQSRILELLSLGLLQDDEASIQLTGRLPPPGYKPLSGTFFKAGSSDPSAVSTAAAQSNTGAVQQDTKSPAPEQPKGPPRKTP